MSQDTTSGRSISTMPGFYIRVPFTYVSGKPVWYVWNETRKTWELPK